MNFLTNYKYWLFAAIILHILVAWFSVGHYHDDEYAQILSFAAARMGVDMQSQLMWEFEAGVRSGFQPLVAYLLSEVSGSVGISSPFIIAFFYRLLSASISLVGTIVFIKVIAKDISSKSVLKWIVFFLLFSWILLFINVRFSSEGWSTSFFILGYGLFLKANPLNVQRYLAVGFFLGLAFLARYQVGFMLFGLGLWMVFIHRINHINLSYILIAGLFTLIIGGGFDWWLYGEPTVSSWNYFKWHYDGLTSLSGGISSTAEPWWFYIQYASLQLIPPITLLLPIVVVVFWLFFPLHPITWLTIPFVFFHMCFGHKEMRYLFPLLPFVPVMFGMLCIEVNEKFKFMRYDFIKYCWYSILGITLFVNVILIILTISLPASKEVALWQNCLIPIATKSSSMLLVLDENDSYTDPMELNLDFYNTINLPVKSVINENRIVKIIEQHPYKQILYASRKRNRSEQLDDANLSYTLACQALPDWILKININNWTSRTSMWRIWLVTK